jgi:hypothetical protein
MSRGSSAQKRSQWRERIERFARSKLSVSEFCRQERVSTASFYRWRTRLTGSSPGGGTRRSPTRVSFVPVQVAAAGDIQVTFPNGVRLAVPASNAELVRISIDAIAQTRPQRGDA